MAGPLFIHKLYNRIASFQRPFYSRYPVTSDPANLSCTPFFIIGSGRSGNTLLRTILTGNSDLSIPPESYRLPFAIKRFHIHNNRDWKEIVAEVLDEFYSCREFYTWEINLDEVRDRLMNIDESRRTLSNIFDELYCAYSRKHAPESRIWGDKTPLNTLYLDWIGSVYPKSKFIHIIRDGRDVADSYLRMKRYQKLEEAARRWNTSINLAQSFGSKRGDDYMEMRYEELVTDTEPVIRQACSFLGIDYSPSMLDHTSRVDKLGDTDKAHHSNLTKPINSESVGKWKKNFSDSEQKEVNRLLRQNLLSLGYVD